MISAALFAIVFPAALHDETLRVGQDNRPLIQQVGLKVTGNNGYEEYLAAGDVARKPSLIALMDEIGKYPNPTYLQLGRKITAELEPALSYLRQGNAKAVYDPRPNVGIATTFPEFGHFRRLGRALAIRADVEFADARPSAGTDTLLTLLEFCDNSGRFGLLSGLVGMASQSVAFAGFEKNIGQLAQKDWQSVQVRSTNLLNKPNIASQILGNEYTLMAKILRKEIAQAEDVSGLWDISDDQQKLLVDEWKRLPKSEKARIGNEVATIFDQQNAKIQSMLAKPEKDWDVPPKPELGGMAGRFIDALMPAFDQAVRAILIRRTQLRLLRLHGAIREYRFENNQLPESFNRLKTPEFGFDPLSGEPFSYEVVDRYAYNLYSKGNSKTGRIELRIRTEPSPEKIDPSIPPLR